MKTAVLLVNLGTPDEPTHKGVRNFLRPFLSDRRVVNLHPFVWFPILYGIVLPFRSGRVAKLYREVWTDQGSPMLAFTRAQVDGVQKILNARLAYARCKENKTTATILVCDSEGITNNAPLSLTEDEGQCDEDRACHDLPPETDDLFHYYGPDESNKTTEIVVSYAMTYTHPSIANEITRLRREQGCERIIVIPMFPQYSSTTTAPILSQIGAQLYGKDVKVPDLRIVHNYHRRRDFLAAIANSIRRHRAAHTAKLIAEGKHDIAHKPRLLLFSYHGIPQSCVDAGDPYADHCRANSELVAQLLGLNEGSSAGSWGMCYQSRFGKAQWLLPYTDDLLQTLPTKAGGQSDCVDIVCPAFAVDCLETLEEIELCSRSVFMDAGGLDYSVVPCLNDSVDHCTVLANVAMDEMHF